MLYYDRRVPDRQVRPDTRSIQDLRFIITSSFMQAFSLLKAIQGRRQSERVLVFVVPFGKKALLERSIDTIWQKN